MKNDKFTKLKRRISYFNKHLSTKLGTHKVKPIVLQGKIDKTNFSKYTRVLKKKQSEKKFYIKHERYLIKQLEYNSKMPNDKYKLNLSPSNEKELKDFSNYIKRLKKTIINDPNLPRIVLSKNIDKIVNNIKKDMIKKKYVFKKDLKIKFDNIRLKQEKNINSLSKSVRKKYRPDEKIFFTQAQIKGMNESYHLNLLSTLETINQKEIYNWVKEQGKFMSYYLYLKHFQIPDFYISYLQGYSEEYQLMDILQRLRSVAKDTYISKLKIKQYDQEILKFLKYMRSKK